MNLSIIQKSIDYIEDNLKTDITAKELSEMAGFSLYHYYRLFQSAVGMPVMQYITRRRLLHAIYDMHCGEKMISVALAYGFETQAGFYKAFVREFGYTPTQFLDMSKKRKPYRINLFKEEHIALSQAIENVGLLTAAPIKTTDGKYVVANEELYFYVTKRLAGSQLKASTMYLDDYVPKARFIGEIIGQLSLALAQVDVITNQANILQGAKDWAIPI